MAISAIILISATIIPGSIEQSKFVSKSYIQAYGTEATQFAGLIENNPNLAIVGKAIQGPAVIVVSGMEDTSIDFYAALASGMVLVAINSPATYGLACVPNIIKTESSVWSRVNPDNTTTVINSTLPVTETAVPSTIISILCGKPVTWRQNFLALNSSLESQQNLFNRATESVNQALLLRVSGQTIAPNLSIKAADSTFTTLDTDAWDTGSYFEYPIYMDLTTVTFGTGGADSFTQDVIGQQMTDHDLYEYYRFDVTTDHDLNGDYQWLPVGIWDGYLYCGPYMTDDVTYLNTDGNAYLLDYGPSTTVGSQQASVSITLSYPPGGSWGWTWDIPDVSYYTDYTTSTVTWQEVYNGPNYWWPPFPLCTQPPACTHYSFRSTRSCAFSKPLFSGIDIAVDTTFNMQIDEVYFYQAIPFIFTTPYTYTISSPSAYCPTNFQ